MEGWIGWHRGGMRVAWKRDRPYSPYFNFLSGTKVQGCGGDFAGGKRGATP